MWNIREVVQESLRALGQVPWFDRRLDTSSLDCRMGSAQPPENVNAKVSKV